MIHRGVSSCHTVSVSVSIWGLVAARSCSTEVVEGLMSSQCVQGSTPRSTANIMYYFIHKVQPVLPRKVPRRRDAITSRPTVTLARRGRDGGDRGLQ
jgi:hypothetical protein